MYASKVKITTYVFYIVNYRYIIYILMDLNYYIIQL